MQCESVNRPWVSQQFWGTEEVDLEPRWPRQRTWTPGWQSGAVQSSNIVSTWAWASIKKQPGKGRPSGWWWGAWQGSLPAGSWSRESRLTGSSCEPCSSDHQTQSSHLWTTSRPWGAWSWRPCWSGSRSISGRTAADRPSLLWIWRIWNWELTFIQFYFWITGGSCNGGMERRWLRVLENGAKRSDFGKHTGSVNFLLLKAKQLCWWGQVGFGRTRWTDASFGNGRQQSTHWEFEQN